MSVRERREFAAEVEWVSEKQPDWRDTHYATTPLAFVPSRSAVGQM